VDITCHQPRIYLFAGDYADLKFMMVCRAAGPWKNDLHPRLCQLAGDYARLVDISCQQPRLCLFAGDFEIHDARRFLQEKEEDVQYCDSCFHHYSGGDGSESMKICEDCGVSL
jgi:hypothetical protein